MQDPVATAVELHQSGRLKEAEQAYRGALRDNPRNPDALHLLGLLAHQEGDNQAGAGLIRRALAGLRRFCQDSTIYFGADPAGFVSATMAGGFNCSLMYQIAEELKAAPPSVLGRHHLSNMWSCRHRAAGGGVLAHTDTAAVTFNFWIGPDAVNLDLRSGGRVVYAQEEPLEWDWMQINRQKSRPEVQAQIEAFLEGAPEIVIPYRCNRAVMFHSDLFHRSDRFAFADDFESRRVNISLLFGRRRRDVGSEAPAPGST